VRYQEDARLRVLRRQRPPKVYQPRARRAYVGELIQIDGSVHAWFEGPGVPIFIHLSPR
jgi:hypothetical protein